MSFAVVPALVCGLVGLLVGTFLHDPIRRMASRQRIRIVAPHCPACGVAVSGRGRVPWLARLGSNHCEVCKSSLWPRFPGVELFTAAVFALVAGRVGWSWDLAAYLVYATTMVMVVVVDRRTYIIPNRVIYPGLFASLALLFVASLLDGDMSRLGQALIGSAAAWAFFGIVWLINRRGIGFGDVRLSALTGLMAGWVGLGNVVLAVFVGLLFGAVGGMAMVVAQRAGMRDPIPFGPFLVAGAFVATFFGTSIDFLLG